MRDFRLRRTGLVISVAVLALSLAGCGDDGGSDGGSNGGDGDTSGPIFPDDFKPVCQGATVSAATAYDENAPTHKAVYFASSDDDDLTDRSSNLPADWTVAFSTEGDALAAIDLVLCVTRTAEELVQECTGYEDEGVDTGNVVNWHTATYDVSVRAATTGQVLAEETMEATDEECPSFVFFDEEKDDTQDMYAEVPEDDLIGFLKPFVQP